MQTEKIKSLLPTRVFRAGNSQAVRIPKAFELPEGEVMIEARDGGLFIRTHRGTWKDFFASLEPLDLSEVLADVRKGDTARSVDDGWLK